MEFSTERTTRKIKNERYPSIAFYHLKCFSLGGFWNKTHPVLNPVKTNLKKKRKDNMRKKHRFLYIVAYEEIMFQVQVLVYSAKKIIFPVDSAELVFGM